MISTIGPWILIVIVAIAAFALNPGITGLGYALLVIVGGCTVWLFRVLYLNELDRNDRGE
ncbi:MAG: hypothetical protein QOE11_548 [Solirubrobacteraceae bacterium]|jgi:hypothetical protein|nr:hypothetical protein [Solirubrobacteraceae bacterium]